MDGGGFNVHLWHALVEDHMFMAKFIYDTVDQDSPKIKQELEKVELSLSTLVLLSQDQRVIALEIDKYEKFTASLAASFDLKNKALENKSFIELLIITANQIDAYLRLAIVMKTQLKARTNRIDITYLFQGESDVPINERKIYRQAKEFEIINEETYNTLEALYKERNKVVHRYIISSFKTIDIYKIVLDYEITCEIVRNNLKSVEDLQFKEGIGIHGNGKDPEAEPSDKDISILYSQINDKHLTEEFFRDIPAE